MTKYLLSILFLILCAVLPACFEAPGGEDDTSSAPVTATKSATIAIVTTALQSAEISSDETSYTFPATVIESTSKVIFTLTNLGDVPAKITSSPQMDAPFSYTDESFPGANGTCKKIIQPTEYCTISVNFSPSAMGKVQSTFRLIYNNGKTSRTFEKTFFGIGYSAPNVLSVTPSYVAQIGGATITLSGSQFFSGASVKIDGKTCAVTQYSSGTITCVAPAHSQGSVDIVVTNTDGKTSTLRNSLLYPPVPTVTSVSPNFGPLAGGSVLTLTGTGFLNGMTVSVGAVTCTSVNVTSGTTATCTTGAHTVGVTSVVVTNLDTQSGTGSNLYTYTSGPTVTSISQSAGSVSGGNTITITGTGFFSGATVDVGGANCTSVVVNSPTQITCTTTSHASLGESWTVMTTVGTPSSRRYFSGVWSGSKLIVWGGGWGLSIPHTNTGGSYDPVTDSWTTTTTIGAPPPHEYHSGYWSGSKMLVWGGDVNFAHENTGALYDPVANTWSNTSTTGAPASNQASITWGGNKMLVWGGGDGAGNYLNTGAMYDPAANTWTQTSTVGAPSQRAYTLGVWTGNKFIILGGNNAVTVLISGGVYDPIANSWTNVSTVGASTYHHYALWIGSKVFLAGTNNSSPGGLYDLSANSWSAIPSTGAPSYRYGETAVWTGSKVIVWGGTDGATYFNSGAYYDPVTNTWSATSTNGVPERRMSHNSVWTGKQMLVWGGNIPGVGYLTGGMYTPSGLGDLTTVTVTNTDAQTGNKPSAFSYQHAPQVYGVTPYGGNTAGGTTITIAGSGFVTGATVLVDGSACTSVSVITSVLLTCTTPAHAAGSVNVVVTNTDTQSATGTGVYTYQAPPTVISTSNPGGGALAGGTVISFNGTGFLTGATATVGGVTCTSPTVNSSTSLTCTTGANSAGTKDIIVTNSDNQSGTGSNLYTYRAAPTVTSVSPTAGALAGGGTLTITGTGFYGGITATVGGTTCTSPNNAGSAVSMTCTLPAKSAGAYTVTVMNNDNQTGSLSSAYTYQPAPTVTSVSPNRGAAGGGTNIDVTGTGFITGATVALGGNTCNSVSVVSSTQITCTTTSGPAWAVDVVVTNTDSQSGTGSSLYTYDLEQWTAMTTIGAPSNRRLHTAIWTGSKMIIWGGYNGAALNTGGQYDPLTDSWTELSTSNCPDIRYFHLAEYTGTKMIIWGGAVSGVINSGGQYDPVNNSWTLTSTTNAPAGRMEFTSIWTGSKMIVWGGTYNSDYFNDGGAYNPNTDTWTSINTTNAPTGRRAHTSVWSGSKMIVFGGIDSVDYFNDGGRYNPITDTWAALTTSGAPPVRQDHTAIWTGSKMLVWGGNGNVAEYTGGQYDPNNDVWTSTSTINIPDFRNDFSSIWTGSKMLVFGGTGAGGTRNTGRIYDPIADTWTSTTTINAPSVRYEHSGVWTGSKLLVFGGFNGTTMNTGGVYTPPTDSAANTWTTMTTTGAPSVRYEHTAVWTGSKMIIFGGLNFTNTGAQYDPVANSWTILSTTTAPGERMAHSAVWTGSKMLVFGGVSGSSFYNSGGQYDPVGNTWTEISTTNAPSARRYQSSVWTGSKMLIFGGNSPVASYYNTGAQYDPTANTWTEISTTNAPTVRGYSPPFWTGSNMLIFGGYGHGANVLNSGGQYDPLTNTWTVTSVTNAPSIRYYHSAVWTGSKLLVFAGQNVTGSYFNTGGQYDPAGNSWTSTSTTNAPSARAGHTGVWTGSKLLTFGGYNGSAYLNTGGQYDPVANSWIVNSTTTAPSIRYSPTAIWTGDKMLIWGGTDSSSTNTGGIYTP